MRIIDIFVSEESGEGLYSMIYEEQSENEFDRLFNLWNNIEYVTFYCWENKEYIETEYFFGYTIDDVINKIRLEAYELERLIKSKTEQNFAVSGNTLQQMFRPLNDKEGKLYTHQQSKAKIDNKRNFPKPILRMYAIRLNKNTFVITGGAIKLTHKMDEHPDTAREIVKMKKVKNFFSNNQIEFEEDLKLFYE